LNLLYGLEGLSPIVLQAGWGKHVHEFPGAVHSNVLGFKNLDDLVDELAEASIGSWVKQIKSAATYNGCNLVFQFHVLSFLYGAKAE